MVWKRGRGVVDVKEEVLVSDSLEGESFLGVCLIWVCHLEALESYHCSMYFTVENWRGFIENMSHAA